MAAAVKAKSGMQLLRNGSGTYRFYGRQAPSQSGQPERIISRSARATRIGTSQRATRPTRSRQCASIPANSAAHSEVAPALWQRASAGCSPGIVVSRRCSAHTSLAPVCPKGEANCAGTQHRCWPAHSGKLCSLAPIDHKQRWCTASGQRPSTLAACASTMRASSAGSVMAILPAISSASCPAARRPRPGDQRESMRRRLTGGSNEIKLRSPDFLSTGRAARDTGRARGNRDRRAANDIPPHVAAHARY